MSSFTPSDLLVYGSFGASTLLLGLSSWVGANTKPMALTETTGTIAIPRLVAFLWLACFTMMFGVLPTLGHFLIRPMGSIVLLALSFNAIFGAMALSSLHPCYHVTWDETGITGPKGMSFWPFRPRKIKLLWPDINSYQQQNGNVVLKAKSRRKIQLSTWYGDHRDFLAALKRNRPDLKIH